MDATVIAVFGFVYAGMMLGRIPGFALDRTGVALLGAILLLAAGRVSPEAAWLAVDVPTIGLLLGLMVMSAQLRLGGLYSAITLHIAAARVGPRSLLALVILASAGLSAVLANDIVCLATTPLLLDGCLRRGLNPRPFLLALACSANVGSAATLIGNPQNMLIGQTLRLSFVGYLADGGVPAVLGCAAVWWVIQRSSRGRWETAAESVRTSPPPYNAWQSIKGLAVLAAVVLAFLLTDWPREVVALAGAGVLLMSRRMHSRHMLSLVDWQLLVLFCGLFVVNHALEVTGMVASAINGLRDARVDIQQPTWLFITTAALSNLVSNVPAVMLLLPAATHPQAGAVLALSSTLAGNLIVVGSIANIIVIEQASLLGCRIGWREHARVGVPVTLLTLLIAAGWLAVRAMMM
jgi:Na+/H+ antiporter NhaD/arsenite permease-like protein